MQWRGIFWMPVVIVMLLVVGACRQGPPPLDAASADAWEKVIVAHTSGVVSRSGEIRVVFAEELSAAAALDAGTLRLEPAVPGTLTLRGGRELVLVPQGELKPGQEYQVLLGGKGLEGLPQGLQPYRFTFRVQTPQYDVALSGLESDPADDSRMILRGVLTTADAEAAPQIERMLQASYLGSSMAATWTHAGNGREHGFTLSGIARQAQVATLELRIDGQPITAGRGENLSVTVPPVGQFAVIDARALEEEGRKQINVTFSDRLDEAQDLRGLVRFTAGNFTTRVEGNRLTVYAADDPNGEVTVTLEAGIRNTRGVRLAETYSHTLVLASQKPQVRFVGNGVILPDAQQMTVAFEAVSVRSVQVVATRIYPENIPQFLQVNQLGGNFQIGRVGRYLWRKSLPLTGPLTGRWQRYELDVTELMQRHPGSLIQLTLQVTPADSAYGCPGAPDTPPAAPAVRLTDQESGDGYMNTNWEYNDDFFGVAEGVEIDYAARWRDRGNPCSTAYYLYGYNQTVQAQRNLLASNLGLLAKSDAQGRLLVSVTNLATAQPVNGVSLQLYNYQNQSLGTATSDREGMATLESAAAPFLLVAQNGSQRGYLRLNNAGALPVSHFDVGGDTMQKGLKGSIYGERGVWRPGDPLGLTFVVHDREGTLPKAHPATLELLDPRGRVTQTLVNTTPTDGFYRFDARTAADAPTGNWTARVTLGGATFSRTVKIETVMPNRLKIGLDLGEELLGAGRVPGSGRGIAGRRASSAWSRGCRMAHRRIRRRIARRREPASVTGHHAVRRLHRLRVR